MKEGTVDPAARLLRLCLRSRWDAAALQQVRDLARQDHVNWERIAQIARDGFLVPILYDTLRGEELAPPALEEEWRRVYYASVLRSTRFFDQLKRVLRGLADAQCPVLLVKGAALAETVYGDPALRPMVDLDVLVPASQVNLAETVLAQLGYTLLTSDPWPGFSKRYRNSVAYVRECSYRLPWMVGLHWHFLDVPYYRRMRPEGWFARAQPFRIAGVDTLVPAPEDHLVYMCGHLAVHHRYEAGLLRYHDMAALIHVPVRSPDWDTVLERARDWRLVIPVQRSMVRLEELWPGTVPKSVLRQARQLQPTAAERLVHSWVTERARTATSDTLVSLATLPGLGARARFLLEAAFPSPAHMRQRYCPRRPWLWPLTYLLRAGIALKYLMQGTS